MKKKILIAGSAGFIGSHLSEFYLKNNYSVIGIDNLITGSERNIKSFFNNKDFKFIKHDITKQIEINSKIDIIMNFACPASPKDYQRYPIETLKVSSIGAENLLQLAIKNKARVLMASTSEIYGDPLVHPQNEEYFGNVNPFGPRSVYDEGKRYMESLCFAYKEKFKLNIRIARIFNTYGPKMKKDDGRVIPNFINQAINNDNFTIYGSGEQTRSFLYVDDCIQALNKLLYSNYDCPINIGNDDEFTINELQILIKKMTKSKSNVIYKDLPINDPKVRKPDISKAKKILKWMPKIKIEDGLKKTIKHFKSLN